MVQNATDAISEVQRSDDVPGPAQPPWLVSLAHDLRSPLSPLTTAIALLRTGRLDATQQGELLATMQRQVDTLAQLIDDSADLLTQRSDVAATTEMSSVLDMALVRVARQLDASAVTVESQLPDAPAWVQAETRNLVRLISHLTLRAAEIAGHGNHLIARVESDGVRIRLDLMPRQCMDGAADAFATLVNRLSDPAPRHVADAVLHQILMRHQAYVAQVIDATPGISLRIAAACSP